MAKFITLKHLVNRAEDEIRLNVDGIAIVAREGNQVLITMQTKEVFQLCFDTSEDAIKECAVIAA